MNPPWHPFFFHHPYAGPLSGPDVHQHQVDLPSPQSSVIWYVAMAQKNIDNIGYQIHGSPLAMATCSWCAEHHMQHPSPPWISVDDLGKKCQKAFAIQAIEYHHCQWVLQSWCTLIEQTT